MNPRSMMRTFGVGIVFIASIWLIMRFGWSSIFPTIYLACTVSLLIFGRFRAFGAAVGGFILLGFIVPAINAAAPAIRQIECSENLKKIASAIRQYETTNGFLPPPFIRSKDGSPLFSWRVLILPYLGEHELYKKLDLNKPWNDPVNLPIVEKMPAVFCCPELRYKSKWLTVGPLTSYVAVIGPQTAWPANQLRKSDDFDPEALNILVVESLQHQTHWASPGDPTVEEFLSSIAFDAHQRSLLNVVELDGETCLLSDNVPSEQIKEFLSIQPKNGP